MSDEFTTNENGSKTPEETNFQDYTAPENEIVQKKTSHGICVWTDCVPAGISE